jgi:glycerophosphoryl diester phosphodiesterase
MPSSKPAASALWRTYDRAPPRIIAHRGASGYRPEHTLEAYALALAQGAEVIEPDLVPSADGILFARHEPSLSRSTDIAMRPEFADRRRGGEWYSEDFLAAELDKIRALQAYPGRLSAFDGRFQLPRWPDLIAWADQAAQRLGRPLTLYPELKQPSALAARNADPVPLFIDSVATLPNAVEIWVQCFEPEPLRRIHEATGLPCALLLDANSDWRSAIDAHGGWLARLGASKRLLRDADGLDSGLVEAAHAAGLRVDAWTFRNDSVAVGFASIRDELRAAMAMGVDGLFCDFPDTAVAERDALIRPKESETSDRVC